MRREGSRWPPRISRSSWNKEIVIPEAQQGSRETLIPRLPISTHQLCAPGETTVFVLELWQLKKVAFTMAIETFLLTVFQVRNSVHTWCQRNASRSQRSEEWRSGQEFAPKSFITAQQSWSSDICRGKVNEIRNLKPQQKLRKKLLLKNRGLWRQCIQNLQIGNYISLKGCKSKSE